MKIFISTNAMLDLEKFRLHRMKWEQFLGILHKVKRYKTNIFHTYRGAFHVDWSFTFGHRWKLENFQRVNLKFSYPQKGMVKKSQVREKSGTCKNFDVERREKKQRVNEKSGFWLGWWKKNPSWRKRFAHASTHRALSSLKRSQMEMIFSQK